MRIWARRNHVGWIHLWTHPDGFAEGEASEHFFDGRTDARWRQVILDPDQAAGLENGGLVEIEDPGYFSGSE
jgi:hypothetical protein